MKVYLKYTENPKKDKWIEKLCHDIPYKVVSMKNSNLEYELEGFFSYFLIERFYTEKEYKALQFNEKLDKLI